MSDSVLFVVAVGASWLGIGLVLSIVMGRRGHDGFGWLVSGTIMGPLAIALAIDAKRHDERLRPASLPLRLRNAAHQGPIDVLVGYDGSAESAAAVDEVVALLGPRLGRLTVATVVSYGDIPELERLARHRLEQLARRRNPRARKFEILHGRPSVALARRAAEDGYDLIAVGTRGAGISKAIFGSAATELARDSKVLVLVVGAGDEAAVEVSTGTLS
jgi:nucleotide-binding universal stress UspA family protein